MNKAGMWGVFRDSFDEFGTLSRECNCLFNSEEEAVTAALSLNDDVDHTGASWFADELQSDDVETES